MRQHAGALRSRVQGGDSAAAGPLLDLALDDHDPSALALALSHLSDPERRGSLARDAARLPGEDALRDPLLAASHMDALARVTHPRVLAWADADRRTVAGALIPRDKQAAWSQLLARLDRVARDLHDLDATAALAALSTAIRATSRALPRAFPRAILNNRLPQGTRWNFLRPFPIDSKVI